MLVNSAGSNLGVALIADSRDAMRCDAVPKTASQLSRLGYRCSHDALNSAFSPVDLLLPRKGFFTSAIVLEQI